MAVRNSKLKNQNTKVKIDDTRLEGMEVAEKKNESCCCNNRWVIVGWVLLLFGGLGHMLPEQMAPLLKWSLWGVSLQMAVGVGSVILALNFLLED